MNRRILFMLTCLVLAASSAIADRTISAEAFRDKLEGMWLGELMGNYAGRQVEGVVTVRWEGADAVYKPITEYNPPWATIVAGQYYNKSGVLSGNPACWLGDDDTALEFVYAHALAEKDSLTVQERTALWLGSVGRSGLYFANAQAWYQINDHGRSADESGTVRRNINAGWTIDAQITTELLGSLAVGMRPVAARLVGEFGAITNEGYSLHAAQFYAAMYAEAAFTADVETLVDAGLEVVPVGSWTRAIIERARASYQADLADDGLLNDWLAARNDIIGFAHQRGRDRIWTESASNTGLTVLAILYGAGDFVETVNLGVRGGEDSDCNPATAGGLIGMIKGAAGIRADLAARGLDVSAIPVAYNDSYTAVLYDDGVRKDVWTLEEVLDIFQAGAERQILVAGGQVTGDGSARQYIIPDTPVTTGDVSDPAGPRGLVGRALEAGQTVTVVVRRDGVVLASDSALDRNDQARLIDGVIDVTSNGVLPFSTYDGAGEAQTDAYELHFAQPVLFTRVILHEGDIVISTASMSPSRDVALDGEYEPKAGYFIDVAVEILQGDHWVEAANLQLSEPLAPLDYFQSIELTFTPAAGSAIRIIGPAGGSLPATTLTELEAFGTLGLPGDADGDSDVDLDDFVLLKTHFGLTAGATKAQGDFDGDGDVDLDDFVVLKVNFGLQG